MKKSILLLSFFFTLQFAHASMMFGNDDNIHVIQELELLGPENKPLQLAHRVTLHFFVAGIYTSDEGYVLTEKGNSELYYSLTPELLKTYQDEGTLPNPLPAYSIPIWDYLFGYSLWIIVGGVILFYVIKDKFFPEKEPQPVEGKA